MLCKKLYKNLSNVVKYEAHISINCNNRVLLSICHRKRPLDNIPTQIDRRIWVLEKYLN